MSDAPQSGRMRTASIDLRLGSQTVSLSVTVPEGPIRLFALLPLAFSLTDLLVQEAAEEARAGGSTVTCSKGCGACCSQLVPISQLEAWHIREVIAKLPPAHRAAVESRFAQARRRLQESRLIEKLLDPDTIGADEARDLGLDYFRLGVPCPFLSDGACSIYPHRPAKCREYLVVSPPECCASPTADRVHCVDLPARISRRLFHFDSTPDSPRGRWVPLSLASAWADAHPPPPPRPGPEALRELIEKLTGPPLPGT